MDILVKFQIQRQKSRKAIHNNSYNFLYLSLKQKPIQRNLHQQQTCQNVFNINSLEIQPKA